MDAQFKKGILDICVLSILEKKEIYGYGLEMEMASLMDVSGNTLYPLLRRLEKDDYLDTYMHVSEQGRRRKYYRITDKGRSHLKELRKDWKAFKEVADRLIGGDVDE
ncbi:Transcriptional regulator PadR-like family protein [Clostridiales bacterium CHKCI006]|uniref:PadR family transcriptional regulator n=1 Tax=Candidatus Fimiplasma intestinipullorum TaxID=2840825 RepID=A0A9D1L146_9FIRM|nr:Transcriptional regulator PadR-like family protein [Clostridiales bacterium CHKCI006]HIU14439.1 PadR family transcriptional regulator [Candidatus Fimiplasma intestinipullorum]